MRTTDVTSWNARTQASVVVLAGGEIVVMGGADSVRLNDVHRSSDAGGTWSVPSTAAWPARRGSAAVALSDDTILVMGGDTASGTVNDVWASADAGVVFTKVPTLEVWSVRAYHRACVLSDDAIIVSGGLNVPADAWLSEDRGATWTRVCSSCPWGPRYGHAVAVLADDTVIMAGGWTTEDTADVWVSSDRGVEWIRILEASPWTPRSYSAMVVLGGHTLMLLGGIAGSTVLNDVWSSADDGASWRALSAADWSPRSALGAGVLADGRVVVLTGRGAGTDVWVGSRMPLLSARPCGQLNPAMCTAPAHSAPVSVALNAAVGVVRPPNARSIGSALFAFTPPVPTITAASGGAIGGSVSGGLAATLGFTYPVQGVAPRDVRFSGPVVVLSPRISGSGVTWDLTVELAPASALPQCPTGYTPSTGEPSTATGDLAVGFCGRVLPQFADWGTQNAACGPYSLATVTSAGEQAFFASLRASAGDAVRYW